jgi:hypothetical protein
MVQDRAASGYNGPGVFNFQYNPSTVDSTYMIQTGGAASAMMFPNANDEAQLAVPLNAYVSWTLLFDRTYELWDAAGYKAQGNGNIPAQQDPTLQGVYADVAQLQWFVGMDQSVSSAVLSGSVVTSGTLAGSNNGVMMMVPAWVYFGGYDVNTRSYTPQGVAYYGAISEWDVTYTHWQTAMVPMRCAIDITFNLYPPPSNEITSQNAGVLGITTSTLGQGGAVVPTG